MSKNRWYEVMEDWFDESCQRTESFVEAKENIIEKERATC